MPGDELETQAFDPAAVAPLAGHWIHGELLGASAASLSVRRPSDGAIQGEIPAADAELVDQAVLSAAAAQPAWAALAPRERAGRMLAWADLVMAELPCIAREEALVSARIYGESLTVDVPAAANWIRFYAEYADKIDGAVTATSDQALSLIVHEPYGVVAAISPWNFPLVLAIWKVAPAIAAGNTVVIKPSELTPYSITRVASLAVAAGIPPGVVNVVQGKGPEAGAALVRHPAVAYIAFTGSTATGARIMTDAAQTGVKPVGLELGGKSPQLVFADSGDLERVAEQVTWGITRNSGQLCYAGTRLVVHRDLETALLEKIAARLESLQPGPTWAADTTLAPIISASQAERIQGLVDATTREGAEIVTGGRRIASEQGGEFFAPTILRGLNASMTGFKEEIFGPVLGVQTFSEDEEAVELAQHPSYGLAGSVYTRSLDKAVWAARKLQAGTVWINGWGRKPDMTSPFGGYKQSGFGKEAGRAGYEKYLRTKAIWINLADT